MGNSGHQPLRSGLSRRDALKLSTALVGAVMTSQYSLAAAPKPPSLNMIYATSEANSDAIKAVLPGFKAETGIDINMDTMPYNALQQKIFAELASGSSYYDVMIID